MLQQGRYLRLTLSNGSLSESLSSYNSPRMVLPLQTLVPVSALKACNCAVRRIRCYNSTLVCLGPLVRPLHIVARVQCKRFLWLNLSAPESSKVYACNKQVWFSCHNKW